MRYLLKGDMMRKILILIFLFIIIAPVLHAGALKSFGVKSGLSVTNLDFSSTIPALSNLEYDNRVGLVLGGFLELFDLSGFCLLG